ncbi:hypothetical protein [Vibrio splendidus]|uniref:hypothetical protein n=1 Tax=Vibrio splendidus TaxID=29497 RepID=UPI000C82380A|nr:hypothetical protein [Vibrio splendidus]PMI54200.1 hypothetical protein BCU42_18810 [Vibrio splendidus]PMI72549.1 hypothetical protein BCU38_21525 [Vibrio splendidus]
MSPAIRRFIHTFNHDSHSFPLDQAHWNSHSPGYLPPSIHSPKNHDLEDEASDFIWLVVKAKRRHPVGYAIAYVWLIDHKHHESSVLLREVFCKFGKRNRQNQKVETDLKINAKVKDGVEDKPRIEMGSELEKWLNDQAYVFFGYLEHLMLKEVNLNG